MAGINAEEVVVGQNGSILLAPLGSTVPTNTTDAWDAAWAELGYATEDGVTLSKSVNVQDIYAWQSLTPLRRLITTGELNAAFTAMQTNEDVLKNWFGATYTNGIYHIPKDPIQPEQMLAVEWIDGSDVFRLVFHKASLGSFGDIPINKQGAIAYSMTWNALPAAAETDLAILIDPTAV